MQKLIHITLFLIISMQVFSQTDGISYQAVIIGPDNQELPGVDAMGNILPNSTIAMRFTIFDSSNQIEFQEEQTTSTDQYGRINLIIGETDPTGFELISWDGSTKNLLVEIDFDGGGNGYIEMSQQELLFVPYAYHRNITATGTLKVDGVTELYSELAVDGITDLNDILNVNNNSPTNLSGDLNVDGVSNLNSSLNVEGVTTLNDSLTVEGAMELNDNFTVNGITHLNDSLVVAGPTALNNNLEVEGITKLNDSLLVEGNTELKNKLFVDGVTTLNDSLWVAGPTNLSNSLNVAGPTAINNTLNVEGITALNDSLNVEGVSNLKNSLIVDGETILNDSLTVDKHTDLNSSFNVVGISVLNDSLQVEGATELNNSLYVNDNTTLNNALSVGGITNLDSSLSVTGITTLNKGLIVTDGAPSVFFGDLTVADSATATFLGPTNFDGPSSFSSIDVAGSSNLNGQVTINTDVDSLGTQDSLNAYPLLVQGSKQGIAIKVNEGRSISNNYVSFWDNTGNMWGRIEGITLWEQALDPEFELEHLSKLVDVGVTAAEVVVGLFDLGSANVGAVASITSSTACVGLGACVTTPIPSFIVSNGFNVVVKIGNWVIKGVNLIQAVGDEIAFVGFRAANIGVSYQSGAGDYAEWLPKENLADVFIAGELVGIKNGLVSKNLWDVEKIMIVSTNPIVLGNMPQQDDEINNVKIAFMGQVPVKVLGNVEPGDYILPDALGSGFAIAVSPADMKTRDYKKVAGVAWNITKEITEGLNIVNVAVGLNTNDLSDIVYEQELEIKELTELYNRLSYQVAESNKALVDLVPGYADAIENTFPEDATNEQSKNISQEVVIQNEDLLNHTESDIIYFEISEDHINTSIDMAREYYLEMHDDLEFLNSILSEDNSSAKEAMKSSYTLAIEDHPFWNRIDNNPAYREEIVLFIQSKLKQAFHTHKEYAHKFTDLEIDD